MGYKVTSGSVFEVKLNNGLKGYFQYIGLDFTQLNSEVIRVFKIRYKSDEDIEIKEIVRSEIEFYAHVDIRYGVQLKLWEKIGAEKLEDNLIPPTFRSTEDIGAEVEISKKWFLWKMNGDHESVGELKGKNTSIDLGLIVIPQDILDRMETGKYKFKYPDY